MAFDNTNRGSIWKNKKKEKDTHPDFTGSLDVGGVAYWVNAWRRKESASADAPALTFSVRPKDENGAKAVREEATPVAPKRRVGGMSDAALDDEVPF